MVAKATMNDGVVLILTNEEDLTTDFVVRALHGTDFLRINTERLRVDGSVTYEYSDNQLRGALRFDGQEVRLDQVRAVYCRRTRKVDTETGCSDEGVREYVRAEFWALLEGLSRVLHVPWVNHPRAVAHAESKILQLTVAQRCGFRVPRTLITNAPARARDFFSGQTEVVAKSLAAPRSTLGGTERILFTSHLQPDNDVVNGVHLAPCILQEFVHKSVDLRVTVVGTTVFAVALDSQSVPAAAVDWRAAPPGAVRHSRTSLPKDVELACISICQLLDLNFGAIDLAIDRDGNHVFFEVNPNGQWAWLQLTTGVPIAGAIADLLRAGK